MPTIDPVTAMGSARVPRGTQTATDGLEAMFLQQMLESAGLRAREGSFSGGAGEQQFQSLLNEQYARILADKIDLKLGLKLGEEGR